MEFEWRELEEGVGAVSKVSISLREMWTRQEVSAPPGCLDLLPCQQGSLSASAGHGDSGLVMGASNGRLGDGIPGSPILSPPLGRWAQDLEARQGCFPLRNLDSTIN